MKYTAIDEANKIAMDKLSIQQQVAAQIHRCEELNPEEEEYKFIIHGRPLVQKNNLNIYKRKVKGKLINFIGHNQKLLEYRERVAEEMYEEYKYQGGNSPIDYLFEIDLVFYIHKKSEPDLDNLPAAILDSLQGYDEGDGIKACSVIENDKLLRKMTARKIVKGDKEYYGEPRAEITIRRYQSA